MRGFSPLLFSIAFISCSQLTNGLLAPALPEMAVHYGVQEHQVQLLVVCFIFGLGISQLFYGPLADAYGRRKVFWLGQAIFLSGNLLTFFGFNELTLLQLGVVVQGLGAGSNQILARCLLSDSYKGEQLSHGFAWLGMAASVIPVIGPVIGGFITAHVGWHYLFILIGLSGASLLLVAGWLMPETRPGKNQPLKPKTIARNYFKLALEPGFINYSCFAWIGSIGVMYLISSAPFVLQGGFGLSADDFGLVMIAPAAGLALGSAFTRRFVLLWNERRVLRLAAIMPMLAAMLIYFLGEQLIWLVVAMVTVSACVGAIYPISQTGLFRQFAGQAGTVSALSGTTQMGLTALSVATLTRVMEPSPDSMAVIFSIMSLMLIAVLMLQQRARQQEFA